MVSLSFIKAMGVVSFFPAKYINGRAPFILSFLDGKFFKLFTYALASYFFVYDKISYFTKIAVEG